MTRDPIEAAASPNDALNQLGAFLVSIKTGAEIFKEGDEGRDFFIIREGSVCLTRTRGRHVQELERLAVGDCLGEASMLGGGRRTSTARALTDCTLVRIELGTLTALLKESPGLGLGLLRKLAVRLLRFERLEAVTATAFPTKREQRSDPRPSAAAPARTAVAPAYSPVAVAGLPAGASASAQLRHTTSGRLFALTGALEAIVGRVDRASGFTPPINFSDLDDGRTIGRQHAKILHRDGEYFVREEIATRNGTFVNGTRLPVNTEQRLADGDRLRFGLIEVVFERG
jgi:CRP-like cAMP-binding protein